MAYTTIKKPSDYFNTKLYTGNGSANHSITGVGFQPDLVWIKKRSAAGTHSLFDVVRGVEKRIRTDATASEDTSSNYLSSFNADGFTVNNDGGVNQNATTLASWNWKANGAGSANTDGSLNSTVSVNQTSGFSVVKYTGNGSDQTVGHGLGVAPSMIIVKCLTTAHDWVVYHQSMGNGKAIALNLTNAEYSATAWQSTSPTNQVFYIKGGANSVSQSGDFVAYCFAEKQGYSKFGSYAGNDNADGTFIYTGFKPAFFITKSRNFGNAQDWVMKDNKRPGYNQINDVLYPNGNYAEGHGADVDFLSNGIKIRSTAYNINRGGGNEYIYMAFAEQPLVGDNPATAR